MRQLFQYHPVIGYRFIPGLRARVLHENGGYVVRANSLGFRSDREYETSRRNGVKRVLLFGDSFTAGDGVNNAQRYGDILEALIPGTEVYNFGLPASGTDQQYLAYEEIGRAIEHDLLVVAVLVDNVRRVRSTYLPYLNESGRMTAYAKPYFELQEDGGLSLRNTPVPRLPIGASVLSREDSEALRRMKDRGRKVAGSQPVPEYDDPSDPAWLVMGAILKRWIRRHPKPVLLFPLPLHEFVEDGADATAYLTRFREVCDATGCSMHDPLGDLKAYPPAERRAFRYALDIHPTPAGHAALACSLARAIRTRLR